MMRGCTVLHMIDTRGPGGAENVFLALVKAFNNDGFRSLALVPEASWVQRSLLDLGVKVVTADAKGSFNVRYLRKILQVASAGGVDIIQAHLLGPNVYASMAGMIVGVPVISTFHGSGDLGPEASLGRVKAALINIGSRRTVAVSRALKEYLKANTRLDAARIVVVHNGVSVDEGRKARTPEDRAALGLPPNAVIVGSVGNIRAAKGYDDLLRAAALVKHACRTDVRFIVAGQPQEPLFGQLLDLQRQLALEDCVRFLGYHPDPRRVRGACDIFVLPSISEGFSIATVEAMVDGLPVIATRSGGPEEIVDDGVNGILVPPGNPRALADAIVRLIENPSLRMELGRQGRLTATSCFGHAKMVESYRTIYESVMPVRPPRRRVLFRQAYRWGRG